MLKETDLERVKRVARMFLMFDPKPTEMSPLVIKHPFTDNGIVCIPSDNESGFIMANILEDNNALENWREKHREMINNSNNVFHIAINITNSYRFAFLKYIMPYLSQKDFSNYLVDAWVLTEAPNGDPNFTTNQMVGLFKKADKSILMDEDELEAFNSLDDKLTVYRGVTQYNANKIRVLSWTLDRDTAEWFAHRFGENGKVYEAVIDKEHILAYFASRKESEVIVEPKYLENINICNNIDISPKMKM